MQGDHFANMLLLLLPPHDLKTRCGCFLSAAGASCCCSCCCRCVPAALLYAVVCSTATAVHLALIQACAKGMCPHRLAWQYAMPDSI